MNNNIFKNGHLARFHIWQGNFEVRIPIIDIAHQHHCPAPNQAAIYMTPCAIRNFGLEIGHRSTYPTKILNSNSDIFAEEVIAIPLRVYNEMTDEQLDLLLSNYFSKAAKDIIFHDNKTLIEIQDTDLNNWFHFELQLVKPASVPLVKFKMFKICSCTRLLR